MIAWAASPDRSRLAISECGRASRCRGLVQLLAMPSMKPLRHVLSLGPQAVALAWDGNNRLLALAGNCCAGSAEIVAINAPSGKVTARRRVAGTVVRFARTGTGFALLTGPRNRIGVADLVIVDGRGMRTVRLTQVEAGLLPGSLRTAAISTDRFPALTVDSGGNRAFVVDPYGTVAEIALGSLAVSYHHPHTSRTFLARLAAWLQPLAHAKGDNGPWRQAQWLGNGLLAVSGTNWHATGSAHSNVISATLTERPAGLEILNTRNWRVHTLDPNADSFTITNRLLLATGTRWDVTAKENRTTGEGLVAYDDQGTVRFRLFARRPVYVDDVADGRAYVTVTAASGYQHQRTVDLRTGRVIAALAFQWPRLLFGDGDPSSA